MENKNIIFNCTLEQYNKKYRNRRHRLLKYTKKQVEDFDKQYGHYIFNNKTYTLEFNKYLLKDRKWALIGDAYYEIPKPVRFTWFRNLSAGVQAISCLVGIGAVSSAVVFPTLAATVWKKGGDPIKPEPITTVDFNTCSWSDLAERCNKLENKIYNETQFIQSFKFGDTSATQLSDFVGKEKTVKVNNQNHIVRIIDVQHGKNKSEDSDKDLIVENGQVTNKVATFTFEFKNVISDSEGNSLAYQWNDSNNDGTASLDYPNSTIRYALTGEGTNGGKTGEKEGEILVAQKEQTTWCNASSGYKKPIIEMLPSNLKNVIKTIQKPVGTTDQYTKTYFYDKLFLPSLIEYGYANVGDQGYGSTYSYYSEHTKEVEAIRIKKQTDNSTTYSTYSQIAKGSGQTSPNTIYNYAGHNETTGATGGAMYWYRSPNSSYDSPYVWNCTTGGGSSNVVTSNKNALPVAPLFCI